jgi:hypothetical protein
MITDYLFFGSDEDGVSFARALKFRRGDLPVCLSTGGYTDEEFGGAIDLILDKSAISWDALAERLRSRGALRRPRDVAHAANSNSNSNSNSTYA